METSGNKMDKSFFARHQLRVFAEYLPKVFVEAGFELVEEPYIDYGLCGYRATYIRRYLLHQSNPHYDGILTTIIHTVAIPFGYNGQKMLILTAPRNLKNEPVSDTLKLRIHFADDGTPRVFQNTEQQPQQGHSHSESQTKSEQHQNEPNKNNKLGLGPCFGTNLQEHFEHDPHQDMLSIIQQSSPFNNRDYFADDLNRLNFIQDLSKYVSHIIEVISPGLIQLPTDMKLEILKKLSVDSIIKVSQVNNEFRTLIFKHGESLWRHLCIRDFNIRFINRLMHKSWMELYRETYLYHQNEICRKERALPGLPERLALPPVPYRLQIEWRIPEVLQLPFYPVREILALPDNPILALEFHPLHRINSLDSLS